MIQLYSLRRISAKLSASFFIAVAFLAYFAGNVRADNFTEPAISSNVSNGLASETNELSSAVEYQPITQEVGVASWYGRKFHGRKTSSGEKYDMNAFTAAHPTLPFGTLVRVTNLENKRSVVVMINDRGPHVQNRIIDLSKAAAQELDLELDHVQLDILGKVASIGENVTENENEEVVTQPYELEEKIDESMTLVLDRNHHSFLLPTHIVQENFRVVKSSQNFSEAYKMYRSFAQNAFLVAQNGTFTIVVREVAQEQNSERFAVVN